MESAWIGKKAYLNVTVLAISVRGRDLRRG